MGNAGKFEDVDFRRPRRFSQAARQAAESPPRISYMKYDRLGRVIEAGEADEPLDLEQFAAEEPWYPAIADAAADQRVFTYYTKRPETAADSVPTAWSAPAAHGESIYGQDMPSGNVLEMVLSLSTA